MRNTVIARYRISGRPAGNSGMVHMYLACAKGAADLAADLVTKRHWTEVSLRDMRPVPCEAGEICK